MKGDVWHMALKILNSPRGFSKTRFWERWGRGVINCCKRLPVRSSATEIRSRWCNSVHVSLWWNKYYSLCWKKSFQAWLSHSKVLFRRRRTLGRLVILSESIHPAQRLDLPTIGHSQLKRQLSVSGPSSYQGPHTLPNHLQWRSQVTSMHLALSLLSLPSCLGLGLVDWLMQKPQPFGHGGGDGRSWLFLWTWGQASESL